MEHGGPVPSMPGPASAKRRSSGCDLRSAKWRVPALPSRSLLLRQVSSRTSPGIEIRPLKEKRPQEYTRLGSVSCCLNSGLFDRATGCRGMGSRPVGLDHKHRPGPGEFNADHVLVLTTAAKGADA